MKILAFDEGQMNEGCFVERNIIEPAIDINSGIQ